MAVRSALRRFGAQGPKSPNAAPSRSGSAGRQAACRQADGFRVFEVGIDADNDDFTDNFNEVMSWIDFHAPAAPATCTLTIFVSDLGNNGMPLLGEVPDFAFDVDKLMASSAKA